MMAVAAALAFAVVAAVSWLAVGMAQPVASPTAGRLAALPSPSAAPSTTAASPAPSPSIAVTPSPSPSATPRTTPRPMPHAAGAPTVNPAALLAARPWLAWRPSGAGRVAFYNLPAPWIGGPATDDVAVYLPPGYDRSPGRRYPVLYEAPTPYSFWEGETGARFTLDALIDEGAIPASIVVFVDSGSGPYSDLQCANTYDGREWLDTFIGQTVVGWVDAHFRTIAAAPARAVFGMSNGGYCAAILGLHHPTVFGAEISFSGYYQVTAVAAAEIPFGYEAALMAAASPLDAAGMLSASERSGIFFLLVADPYQSFYASQASAFAAVLARDGYPHSVLWTGIPHGWSQVNAEFARTLELVAAREVATGVFR